MTMRARSAETPKREILVFYYKYRTRLFLSFLVPFLLAIAISFVPTPRYRAESTLVVRLGSEYVYQPEIGTGTANPASPIPFDRDQIYKVEVAILGGYDLHKQVVEKVGVDRMYPVGKPGLLHDLFAPARDWAVGEIDAAVPDIEHASAPVQWLRNLLEDLGGNSRLSEDEKEKRRLALAVERFERHLSIVLGKDSAVINVSFEHPDRDVSLEALNTLLDLYLDKRKQIYLDTRGAIAHQQEESTRRHAAAAQAAVEEFKRENQIYSLPDQRTQLLAQREDVRKQMMTLASPTLQDRLDSITKQLDDLDALERRYDMLQHDVQIANDEYSLYSHKFEEAQSYDDLERARAGSVRVIQPPAAPPEPRRLQRLIVAAGFVFALVCMAVVAAFTEFTRSGFLTPEGMERNLGLPILAALPRRR